MPRVLDLVRSSLRRLKCWGKYLSPDDVRLLLASRWVLSDIEPHLNNIADRQAALLHNSAEYTFAVARKTHVDVRVLFLRVFRKTKTRRNKTRTSTCEIEEHTSELQSRFDL